jgi:hypothetical protein
MRKPKCHSTGLLVAASAMSLCASLPVAARAQSNPATAMDDRWHFQVAPYLWGSGMKGTVGAGDVVEAPVDVSFGSVLENLDFALLGHFEGRRNRLGFGVDMVYMNLGADASGPASGGFGLGVDLRSLTAEGLFTYRVHNDEARGAFVDILGGLRYMKMRAGFTLSRDGDEIGNTERTLDWVDALAGARFMLPLGGRVGLHGRADIAGFGSDLTWNVLGGLDVKLGERWRTGAGYRYMDVDYDEGEDRDRRIWQITYQGPYLFVAYAW